MIRHLPKAGAKSFLSQRAFVESTRQPAIQAALTGATPHTISQRLISSIDFFYLFFIPHKQELCHAVNKNILAGTMPIKRQGKASGEYHKASDALLRYIAI